MDGAIIVAHWRCNAEQTEGTGDDAVTYSGKSTVLLASHLTQRHPITRPMQTLLSLRFLIGYGLTVLIKDATETSLQANIDGADQPCNSFWRALVMIAELVAFNAAFGVVKQFIENGKDLHDCFGQIGQMVNAKEDLKARQQKNKKSLFASDAEEFMALEQIAKAEQELQDFMVYYGRAGLWDDFIVFQAKARKARLEAKNAHAKKINQRMHYAGLAVSCVLVCVGLYACFIIIYAIVK
jgi:hypothetical protein